MRVSATESLTNSSSGRTLRITARASTARMSFTIGSVTAASCPASLSRIDR